MPRLSSDAADRMRRVPAQPGTRLARFLGVVMLLALTQPPLFAQVIPPVFDPTGRSGEPSGPLKKEFPPPGPPPGPVLPPVPRPPDGDLKQPLGQIRVFVHDIHVTGSTVFTDAEIDAVTSPYKGRTLTTDDLERLRLALTLLYVNHGYITSGAIIPDQDVTFNTITIQIVEGALARIDVEGTEWFRPDYLRDRVALGAGTPFAIAPLQERLQLLQQDSRIERINAELRPGDRRGESILNLRVTEASPWKAWLDLNNHQTPVVGAERGLATVAHQNLTGHGDLFSFTYGRSRGVNPIIDTSYTLPVSRYDTTVTGYYRRNDFLVVADNFRSLDVRSDAEIIGVTIRQPLYKTLTDEFAVAVTGERLYNKVTWSVGTNDLIPGSSDTGVNTVSALRFIQEYVHRTPSAVVAARSRFSIGLDALGATNNAGPLPDSQFFSWLGQVQGLRRLDDWGGVQLLGQMSLQLSNDRLFPLEQVPVGGRFSVRGYRENTLIRDNAFLASLESRIPLLAFPSGEPRLQFAQFADMGRAWDAKGSTAEPNTLASVGLGLRWTLLPQERARFELYWGHPLNHVSHPPGNLQDHGIHLQMVVQVL
ncbi:MAG: ShlB/FhaC/HecB family hemolysin secretion/activation protein [Nitrospira sp.]|jgi:hemolysin activation/secretion protein|nr:ShlB/FhaC/HecB family hemolysin secretion/activation protein [Nitrospira sp.]